MIRVNKLQKTGWILSVLLPIGGVMIGIFLMTKDRVGVGIAQVIVSVLMMNVWAGLFPVLFTVLAG